ncbi:MAG: flagellar hook-associated protein FlgK [Candidatus Marinimicrobia bacterium]|nr:flagellar hook-associated protein FlgK [Candidatus Neomarinimicrobiota bacterium]
MSISAIMDNSTRGITANKSAIELTSENIANINTPGYSRRLATFKDMNSQTAKFGTITGSQISKELARIRNDFIEEQYLTQNPNLSKYQMDTNLFSQIEDIFGEPGENGIGTHLSEFWTAWGDLASDPESEPARMVVVDKAVALEKAFNRVNSELTNMKQNIATNLAGSVNEINAKLRVLSQINQQITANNSDALMDERDKIVSDLSNYFEIQTYEGDHGEITVAAAGQILISSDEVNEIEVYTENVGSDYQLKIRMKGSNKDINIQSGELGSMTIIANEFIPNYRVQLDNVATNLANEVNTIHVNGYDLEDHTGNLFFKDNVNSAGNFAVNPLIAKNPYMVATSNQPGESANNNIARQINELQNGHTLNGLSISDYYTGIATDIGSKVQKSENLLSSQTKILATIENQRDSEAGVSLDEELVNLSRYQQAYQASAKIIGTVQEMVDTILTLI